MRPSPGYLALTTPVSSVQTLSVSSGFNKGYNGDFSRQRKSEYPRGRSRPWAGFWAVGLLLARSGYAQPCFCVCTQRAPCWRPFTRSWLRSYSCCCRSVPARAIPHIRRGGWMAARMRQTRYSRGHGVGARARLCSRRAGRPHGVPRLDRERAQRRDPPRAALVGGNQRDGDALVTQEIAGGVVAFFVEFAAVTLPNMFMRNLVDILCDIMIFGLVIAVANAVEGTAARRDLAGHRAGGRVLAATVVHGDGAADGAQGVAKMLRTHRAAY